VKKSAKTTPNPQLKRARVSKGWSQDDVAREVGTDAFTISRWERGATVPGPHFRAKLSALFGLSVAELGLLLGQEEEVSDQAANEVAEATLAPILDAAIPAVGARTLVGRDDLIQQLKQRLLAGGRVALSALNGLPGVGKTALATALAHDAEVRAHFPDGILWAGLGDRPDVLGLLSRWGTLLNNAPADQAQRSLPAAWAACIHAAIGQRRMLLIIDDAWDITHALAFQVGGSHCAHLVTTRFPEIARRFAADGTTIVSELAEIDGRLLLMRLAPEAVQAEPEEAQALVAAVGGLPLALTLLGHYLRAQAHSGQPRRLRAALERLHSRAARLQMAEAQALVESHPSLSEGAPLSLQAVIGISDQQMSADARAALRTLAVFPPKPDTFSEEAAVFVSAQPVETLDLLTDAGLLESNGPGRYTLHQTIADYARAHLDDDAAAGRLVAYFVAYLEAHSEDYSSLERESGNILAALEVAFEQAMQPELVRAAHAFAPFLGTRGLYPAAETLLQRSLEAAQALEDVRGQATSLLCLGKIAEQRGNYTQARECWQNGLLLARQSGNAGSAAQLLLELGNLAWEQGQPEQARRLYEEALDILRQIGDQRGTADTLKSLGNLAADQGQPKQAHRLYEEALELFRAQGDQRGAAFTLHNLGVLAREQGQLEQARRLYEKALDTLRSLGDRRSIPYVLNNLGNLARQQKQFAEARQFLEEALAIQRDLEDRQRIAFVLYNLANVAVDQRQFTEARRYLDEAIPIFTDLQGRRHIALAYQTLGILEREQGQYEQARQRFEEALAIFQDIQDRRQIALTKREQGTLAREQGYLEQARQLYEEALDMLRLLEDRYEIAITDQHLAALESWAR
jgi:tetratricopeptide (TPR) repeat protein/transcriptional regulator with XRE-family HTH domain